MHGWPTGRVVAATLALALSGLVPAHAVDVHLDREAIDGAIVFARQATRGERAAFHDGYLRSPGSEVRRVSIVTEYRRVVLLMEEKMRVLDRNYGVRQMTAAIAPYRGLVEIIVELQFHPQNSYVQVPLVDVLLVPLDSPGVPMPLVAEATDRRPHFGLFWEPTPAEAPWWPFPPSNGAVGFARGRYEVAIKNGGESLGRVPFDFGAIR